MASVHIKHVGINMRAYNHLWEINTFKFREVGKPIKLENGFLYLTRNGVEYRMPTRFIAFYVPIGKFFIEISKVSKYLERVKQ